MYLDSFDNDFQIFDHLKYSEKGRLVIMCYEWELFHNREAEVHLPGSILLYTIVSR